MFPLHLGTMRVQEAEDHSVPGGEELGVPVESVIAPDPAVKMVFEFVSKIISAQVVSQTVNVKFPVFYPGQYNRHIQKYLIDRPVCESAGGAPEEGVVGPVVPGRRREPEHHVPPGVGLRPGVEDAVDRSPQGQQVDLQGIRPQLHQLHAVIIPVRNLGFHVGCQEVKLLV